MKTVRLQQKYKKEVIPQMMQRFGYKNDMAVPKVKKVIVNAGFGRMVTDKTSKEAEKIQKYIFDNLALITGQKPQRREAKKSISSFKLRKGMIVGARVSLGGKRMYDFLERLIWLVLPRTRDFKGLSPKTFDKEGNLTIGFKEYTPFPEIIPEKDYNPPTASSHSPKGEWAPKGIFGLEITVVTTAKNKEEGIELLKLLGFPIKV